MGADGLTAIDFKRLHELLTKAHEKDFCLIQNALNKEIRYRQIRDSKLLNMTIKIIEV